MALFIGFACAFILSSFFGNNASAAFTPKINYQGKLTNASGSAVADGTYNMRFWLLTSQSIATSSAVWTESLTGSNKVTVQNGLFSVMLGSTSPLTSVDFDQPLYLGVEIGGTGSPSWDGEMSPRKVIGSVPSAFEAEHADDATTVGGVASTSFLRSDQADTATGLLTFSNGFLSQSSSTIARLTTLTATTTNLVVNGERFTDLTGTGLQNSGNTLSINTTYLNTLYASTTAFDTCSELAAIMSGETGTCGSLVLSASPTFTGTVNAAALTLSSTLTLSGSAANIALGSNYLSGDGGDEGIYVTSGGFVGVGANDPDDLFEVRDGILRVTNDASPAQVTLYGDDTNSGDSGQNDGRIAFRMDDTDTVGWNIDAFNYGSSVSTMQFTHVDGDIDVLTLGNGTTAGIGYVGVGTSSPSSRLEVWGNLRVGTSSIPALFVNTSNGRVGIGVSSPSARLHLVSTTEQLRNGYDASNYLSVTTGSTGTTTFDAVGTSPALMFADNEFQLFDNSDNTKRVEFQLSGIAAGTKSTWTFPAGVGTFVGLSQTQTLTNKTLTAPTLSSPNITGSASTSRLYISGALYDSSSSAGTNGYVLRSTGTSTRWVATSTLGFGTGTVTGSGSANRVAYWSGASALTSDSTFTFANSKLTVPIFNASGASTTILSVNNISFIKATTSSTNASTLIGLNAGQSLGGNGVFNTALGYEALNVLVSGDNNTAVGYKTLDAVTAGENTAVGSNALTGVNTGVGNVGIGYNAGASIAGGSYNVAVGWGADTGSGGDHNVLIGKSAGAALTSGGDHNILVGYQAGDALTGATTNNILIGYDIDLPSALSNRLNIGNLLFGTGIDGTGTTLSSGNIGIGTTTPNQRLSIFKNGGDAAIEFSTVSGANEKWTIGVDDSDGTKFKISSSSALGTNDRLVIDGRGYVGIGTSAPDSWLTVLPASGSSIGSRFYNDDQNEWIDINDDDTDIQLSFEDNTAGVEFSVGIYDTGDSFRISNSTSLNTDPVFTITSGTRLVGIGTTTPTQELSVVGDLQVTGRIYDSSNSAGTNGMVLKSTGTGFTWVATSTLGITGGSSLFTDGGATTYLTANTDNLGLGTTTANQALSIFRNGADAAIEFSTVSGANEKWTIGIDDSDGAKFKISSSSALGTNDRLVIDGRGLIGIGTSSPAYNLHIAGTNATLIDSSEIIRLENTTGHVAGIGFKVSTTYNDYRLYNNFGSLDVYNTSDGTTNFRIDSSGNVRLAGSNADSSPALVATFGGLVGIGTTTPSTLLHLYKSSGDTEFLVESASGGDADLHLRQGSQDWWLSNRDDNNSFRLTYESTAMMSVMSDGKVGFGTTTPQAELVVAGGSDAWTNLTITTSDTTQYSGAQLDLTNTAPAAANQRVSMFVENADAGGGGDSWFALRHQNYSGTSDHDFLGYSLNGSNSALFLSSLSDMTFETNGTERLTITQGGFLGIGTSSPDRIVHIESNMPEIQFHDTDGTASWQLGPKGDKFDLTQAGVWGGVISINSYPNYIGISTTTPQHDLHIVSQTGSASLMIQNGGTNSYLALKDSSREYQMYANAGTFGIWDNDSGATRLAITSAGRVGIGTTTPAAKLNVHQGSGGASTDGFYLSNTAGATGRLYLDTNNVFLIQKGNNTAQLALDNNGRVGIGTTTPNQKLSIFASAADAAIEFSTVSGANEKWTIGVDDSDGTKFKISSSSALGTNDRLVIDGAGNVGIGVTSPYARLHVIGTAAEEGSILINNYEIKLDNAGQAHWSILNGTSTGKFMINDTSANANVGIYGTNRFTIDTSGNVGIGTTTPAGEFQVYSAGNTNAYITTDSGNSASIYFGERGDNQAGRIRYENGSDYMSFFANASERMRITSAGNMLIGTTTDTANSHKLVVRSSDYQLALVNASNNRWGISNWDGTNGLYFQYNGTNRMFLTSAGNLGIGTTTVNQALSIFRNAADAAIEFSTISGADEKWTIGVDDSDGTKFKISSSSALGTNDRLVIDGRGYVGINTNSPTQRLTVAGNILLSSQAEAAIAWGSGYNGSQESITALIEFNGYLYAGQGNGTGDGDVLICTPSAAGSATDCDNASDWATSYDGSQEVIWTLAEYKGKLYAGQGSTLGSPTAGDGDIFVCNPATTGDTAKCDSGDWSTSRDSAALEMVFAMAEFNGKLYAVGGITTGTDGDIYVCNPDTAGTAGICDNASDWTTAYDGAQEGFASLAAFNGRLYAGQGLGSGDGDILASSDGTTWATSYNGAAEYFRGMAVYNGKLYAAQSATAAGSADVYQTSDGVTWSMSFNGAQEWLNALAVYNGSIYTAQGNSTGDGDIFAMTGSSTWQTSYNGSQEEITSFAVYNGKLYAGQGNGTGDGDVLYMNQVATTSYALKFAAGNSTGDFWFAEESLWGAGNPNGEIGVFKLSHALVTSVGSYDVAEDYPTKDKDLMAGEILAYDPEHEGHLTRATPDSRMLLAGVVSAEPGFLLSSGDRNNMVPTALVGRVPVKVTNENGKIEVGDSVTISSRDGVGMKARFGDKAIGYALQSFDSEDSETILVYVSQHYAFGMNPDSSLLVSSSTATSTESITGEGIIQKLVKLADAFADGILRVMGLKTEVLCITDATGETCINRAQLDALLGDSNTPETPSDPEPEPEEPQGGGQNATTTATSTEPTVPDQEEPEPETGVEEEVEDSLDPLISEEAPASPEVVAEEDVTDVPAVVENSGT